VYIILCILAGASVIWLGLAGLALRDVRVCAYRRHPEKLRQPTS
jgi:hypothetical protein